MLVSPASRSHRVAIGLFPVPLDVPSSHTSFLLPLASQLFRDFTPADRIAMPDACLALLCTVRSAFKYRIPLAAYPLTVGEQPSRDRQIDIVRAKRPPSAPLPWFLVLEIALIAHVHILRMAIHPMLRRGANLRQAIPLRKPKPTPSRPASPDTAVGRRGNSPPSPQGAHSGAARQPRCSATCRDLRSRTVHAAVNPKRRSPDGASRRSPTADGTIAHSANVGPPPSCAPALRFGAPT